jgi:hypothetical protein
VVSAPLQAFLHFWEQVYRHFSYHIYRYCLNFVSNSIFNSRKTDINFIFRYSHTKSCKSCCSCRWGETMSLNCGHQQTYCSSPRYMSLESHGGMILTEENRKTRRRTCLSATLSTTNPTRTNPGLGGKRPATNHLSHGTTYCILTAVKCHSIEVE